MKLFMGMCKKIQLQSEKRSAFRLEFAVSYTDAVVLRKKCVLRRARNYCQFC